MIGARRGEDSASLRPHRDDNDGDVTNDRGELGIYTC